jgi:hypothetical protein
MKDKIARIAIDRIDSNLIALAQNVTRLDNKINCIARKLGYRFMKLPSINNIDTSTFILIKNKQEGESKNKRRKKKR